MPILTISAAPEIRDLLDHLRRGDVAGHDGQCRIELPNALHPLDEILGISVGRIDAHEPKVGARFHGLELVELVVLDAQREDRALPVDLGLEELDEAFFGMILVQAGHHLGTKRIGHRHRAHGVHVGGDDGNSPPRGPAVQELVVPFEDDRRPARGLGSLGTNEHVDEVELGVVVNSHDSPSRIRSRAGVFGSPLRS